VTKLRRCFLETGGSQRRFRELSVPRSIVFRSMRIFLIACCVIGVVVPYWFALPFFLIHGPNFRLFVEEIFATRISSFFAADLIIASVVFLTWSRRDARDKNIKGWWLVLVSNFVVGLSLALPLYLLKRLDSTAC
jgi:Terpene cyclase DEP1